MDIDYPALISIKARKVSTDPSLTCLLHDIQHYVEPTDKPSIRLRSDEYLAIGCDLEQLDWLNSLFEKEGFLDHEILFTAEVSVTYMRTEAANALIKWAGSLPNGLWILALDRKQEASVVLTIYITGDSTVQPSGAITP